MKERFVRSYTTRGTS